MEQHGAGRTFSVLSRPIDSYHNQFNRSLFTRVVRMPVAHLNGTLLCSTLTEAMRHGPLERAILICFDILRQRTEHAHEHKFARCEQFETFSYVAEIRILQVA